MEMFVNVARVGGGTHHIAVQVNVHIHIKMPVQTDITGRTPKEPVTVSASKVIKILYQVSNVTGSDICTYITSSKSIC